MSFGTVIKMQKGDLFITQAMLATYLSVEHKSYLDLIEPFVLKCLPSVLNEQVDILEVQTQVNKEYNLDILYNVIEKILQRLAKKDYGSYIRRESGKYLINKVYNDEKFNDQKSKIKNALEKVIFQLKNFLINEKKQSHITDEKAKEYLSIFLDTYNYTIYENVENANYITLDEKNQSNFYVAQFILSEYKKRSSVYECILEIIKGTLVAKSIYFFMYSGNGGLDRKKITGTKFYLDTRVLIGILGINTSQEHRAISELIGLLVQNGGRLCTFRHYVIELQGILYKYVKDPSSRLSLSLKKFTETKKTAFDVEEYSKTIDTRLQECGITIEELPDYDTLISSQKWHIDYSDLCNTLSASINYNTSNPNLYSDSLKNDCDTIEAIAFYRQKSFQCSIENCKAIFVTKNKDIVNVVNKLYHRERFSKGEINFAISDVDLTAMLWLKSFGEKSELPQLKLLEDVYAACAPSTSVMKAFLNRINIMEDSEKLTKESAILMRSEYSMMDELVDITDNASSKVTDEIILEMHARLINREKKQAAIEARKNLNSEWDALQKEQERNRQETKLVDNKRSELIQLQKAIRNERQDLAFVEKRLEKIQQRNEVEANNNQKVLDKIDRIKHNFVKKAQKKAKSISKIANIMLNVICILLCIALTVLIAYATYKVSDFTVKNLWMSYVLVGVASILGVITMIYSFAKFLKKKFEQWCERIYDKVYSAEMNKAKEVFSEDTI